ncbi:MAG: hypothetical protein U1E05_06750 [Patescibacteria group bacterium]|nr:hypothetical protein [Patescibacteria group bacterium]
MRRRLNEPGSLQSLGRGGTDQYPKGRMGESRTEAVHGPRREGHPAHSAVAGRPDRNLPHPPRFSERIHDDSLQRLKGPTAERMQLHKQFEARDKGDIARRLETSRHFDGHHPAGKRSPGDHHGSAVAARYPSHHAGKPRPQHYHTKYPDWHRHYHGHVSPRFTLSVVTYRYPGYHWYAGPVWYPRWNPWVVWSWNFRSHPYYDPRPIWCRPVVYTPCVTWSWWQPPVWQPLPVVSAGTWVDVEPIAVPATLYDLQLLAVRMVDPGHPQEDLGPRYRVWFRNNSTQPITAPISVVLLAGNDEVLVESLPQAGVEVTAVEAGDTQSVDIRLPYGVMTMNRDEEGQAAPFSALHVLVNAHRSVAETSMENNGATLAAADVLLVDPTLFAADPNSAATGGEVILAGEGLGPVPGQVLVYVAGREIEGEILGWYDLGVQFQLPTLALAAPAQAEVIIVRSDGAASNPIPVTITP